MEIISNSVVDKPLLCHRFTSGLIFEYNIIIPFSLDNRIISSQQRIAVENGLRFLLFFFSFILQFLSKSFSSSLLFYLFQFSEKFSLIVVIITVAVLAIALLFLFIFLIIVVLFILSICLSLSIRIRVAFVGVGIVSIDFLFLFSFGFFRLSFLILNGFARGFEVTLFFFFQLLFQISLLDFIFSILATLPEKQSLQQIKSFVESK
eukprot:TRINITY_DN161_c0_g1_i6.p1 TRINITY_DN161_c0_g1~~TRINITY_DN161_c0_g1_i6.p1  ORF type:complete len:206 (+),score=46.29 TRINITY_DN161_c0_g1_i6:205-822(+)